MIWVSLVPTERGGRSNNLYILCPYVIMSFVLTQRDVLNQQRVCNISIIYDSFFQEFFIFPIPLHDLKHAMFEILYIIYNNNKNKNINTYYNN